MTFCLFFSGIMSSGMGQQQPPKEDEEEEDEEQGEEFSFEDSVDEEKPEEDRTGIPSDSVCADESSKKEASVDSVPPTGADGTQPLTTLPPAGPEGVLTEDGAAISTAGNTFSGL